jgi:glycosyltransferase involved in cell wall biosynthesis
MNLLDVTHFASEEAFNQGFTPRVTVVICTCQRPQTLARCLAAVARLHYPSVAVVVVDNAPAGGEVAAIARRFGAEYRAAPVRGVSRARNIGARAAEGEIVAYVDDDMVPHPDWLQRIVREFQDPRVMAAAGPVLPLDLAGLDRGALASAIGERPWGSARFQVDRGSRHWFERANFGGIGDGNMAFRRAVFAAWPGFEERIGRGVAVSGGEEHYAFFTLIDRGHRVAYTPDAMVFHPDTRMTPQLKLRRISEASAYGFFVAARHPRHAAKVARFFVEAALRRKRAWRSGHATPLLAGLPLWGALRAFAAGLAMCWRARPHRPARAAAGKAQAIARI